MEQAVGDLEHELGQSSEAIRGRDARIAGLEGELGQQREVTTEVERHAAELRAELEHARILWEATMRGLAAAGRHLDQLRINARGQATRMRLRALREAAELSAALSELGDGLTGDDRDRLLDAVEAAIGRIGAEWDEEEPVKSTSPVATAEGNGVPRRAEASGDGARGPAGADGLPARAEASADAGSTGAIGGPGPAKPRAGEQRSPERRYQGRVSVDVGPFSDYAQLVSFEDAASEIGAAGEISIRRFSGGRAQIDLDLDEPVALLRELEQRCDLDFRIRSTGEDEIVLDVGE